MPSAECGTASSKQQTANNAPTGLPACACNARLCNAVTAQPSGGFHGGQPTKAPWTHPVPDRGFTVNDSRNRTKFSRWLPRHIKRPTFPSRLPVVQLDYIYSRGLSPRTLMVPQGRVWARMSDHLPLIGEFAW